MQPQLTIAIPTYNRNAILADRLPALLEQMRPSCQLLILDNHSDVPVADTIAPVLTKYPDVAARVIRNPTNVGSNANILKCFELCETRWIWILGDDDFVRPNALDTIGRCFQQYPDAVMVNFSTAIQAMGQTRRCKGRIDFLAHFHFGNSLLISTNLYRCERLKAFLEVGYFFPHTMAPHLAMVVSAVQADAEAVLHSDSIVDWSPSTSENAPESHQRSVYPLLFMELLDLRLSQQERKLLFRAVRQGTGLRSQTRDLLKLYSRPDQFYELRYRFDTMMLRWIYYEPSLARRAVFYGFKLLVRFPRLLALLFGGEAAYKRLEARAKGKKEISSAVRDAGKD